MAVTHLATWGAPGPRVFKPGSSRNPPAQRTQLRVTGAPGTPNHIGARAPSILVPIVTADTWSIQFNEDPVDSNQIITQDTYRVSLAELSQLFNSVLTTDTYSVSISETIGLIQLGVVPITTTDTWSVSGTESSVVSVSLATTDTWSVSSTDTSVLSTPALVVATSDTYSVSATESAILGIFTGVLQITVTDIYAFSAAESSNLVQITPSRPMRIRIQPLTARIRITPI